MCFSSIPVYTKYRFSYLFSVFLSCITQPQNRGLLDGVDMKGVILHLSGSMHQRLRSTHFSKSPFDVWFSSLPSFQFISG